MWDDVWAVLSSQFETIQSPICQFVGTVGGVVYMRKMFFSFTLFGTFFMNEFDTIGVVVTDLNWPSDI